MDDGDRQKILLNIDKLMQLTEYDELMDRCIKSELIFNQMRENIEMTPDDSIRHRQLIEKITHRGPMAFKKFTSLLNISFPEAYHILETKYSGVHLSLHEQRMASQASQPPALPPRPPPRTVIVAPVSVAPIMPMPQSELPQLHTESVALPNKIIPAFTDVSTVQPIDVGGGLKLQYYTEEVKPQKNVSVKLSDRFHSSNKISTYDMKSAKRGLLFLVNIVNFEKKSTRHGATVDRDNLITLFRQMDFQVIYYEDITKAQFFSLLNKFVTSPFIRGIDCLVFGLLSHGDEHFGRTTVEFYDGSAEVNDILSKFSNAECLKLVGKPKIFLFPFCRGPISDPGINSHVQAHRIESDSSSQSEPEPMQETNVATFSDIKICYGTLPGFKAFRDPNEGSWYIQVLCDVFAEHAHDTHLEDLIKIIGNTLSTRRTDQMHIQTGSNTDRGFFKTLFFNPGYYG